MYQRSTKTRGHHDVFRKRKKAPKALF